MLDQRFEDTGSNKCQCNMKAKSTGSVCVGRSCTSKLYHINHSLLKAKLGCNQSNLFHLISCSLSAVHRQNLVQTYRVVCLQIIRGSNINHISINTKLLNLSAAPFVCFWHKTLFFHTFKKYLLTGNVDLVMQSANQASAVQCT